MCAPLNLKLIQSELYALVITDSQRPNLSKLVFHINELYFIYYVNHVSHTVWPVSVPFIATALIPTACKQYLR